MINNCNNLTINIGYMKWGTETRIFWTKFGDTFQPSYYMVVALLVLDTLGCRYRIKEYGHYGDINDTTGDGLYAALNRAEIDLTSPDQHLTEERARRYDYIQVVVDTTEVGCLFNSQVIRFDSDYLWWKVFRPRTWVAIGFLLFSTALLSTKRVLKRHILPINMLSVNLGAFQMLFGSFALTWLFNIPLVPYFNPKSGLKNVIQKGLIPIVYKGGNYRYLLQLDASRNNYSIPYIEERINKGITNTILNHPTHFYFGSFRFVTALHKFDKTRLVVSMSDVFSPPGFTTHLIGHTDKIQPIKNRISATYRLVRDTGFLSGILEMYYPWPSSVYHIHPPAESNPIRLEHIASAFYGTVGALFCIFLGQAVANLNSKLRNSKKLS